MREDGLCQHEVERDPEVDVEKGGLAKVRAPVDESGRGEIGSCSGQVPRFDLDTVVVPRVEVADKVQSSSQRTAADVEQPVFGS